MASFQDRVMLIYLFSVQCSTNCKLISKVSHVRRNSRHQTTCDLQLSHVRYLVNNNHTLNTPGVCLCHVSCVALSVFSGTVPFICCAVRGPWVAAERHCAICRFVGCARWTGARSIFRINACEWHWVADFTCYVHDIVLPFLQASQEVFDCSCHLKFRSYQEN